MQEHLAQRIARLPESATIRMAQLSRELKARGVDVVDLSLGEPDFDTPDHIRQAAKQAIDDGYTHYPPVPGYADLREVISEKFKRDNGLAYTAEQIVVSTGAKQTLANAVLCLVDPGEEVILPAPYWVSYAAMVKLAEGRMVEVPTTVERDFKISPEQLREALSPRSRLMIFSSPCNPSGTVYTQAELEALAAVIAEHEHLIVISDEIYEHINFTGSHASLAAMPGMEDRVITVNGLSKGFAMTGWRLGYLGAPAWIAKACARMQGQYTSGTSSITQRAAIAALQGDLSATHQMREAFARRRELVHRGLSTIEGIRFNRPQGAFYFFPDIRSFFGRRSPSGRVVDNPDDMAAYLLEEVHLSMVSGTAFGDPNCIRLSYATDEETLNKAIDRLGHALSALS